MDEIPDTLILELKFSTKQKNITLDFEKKKIEDINKNRESNNKPKIELEHLEKFISNVDLKNEEIPVNYNWKDDKLDHDMVYDIYDILKFKEDSIDLSQFDQKIRLYHKSNLNSESLLENLKEITLSNMIEDIGEEEYKKLKLDPKSRYNLLFNTLLSKKVKQINLLIDDHLNDLFPLDSGDSSSDLLYYLPDKYLIEIPKDKEGNQINFDKIEFSLRTLDTVAKQSDSTTSRQIYQYSLDVTDTMNNIDWRDNNNIFFQNDLIVSNNIFPRILKKNDDIEVTSSGETKDYFLKLIYGIHKSIYFIKTDQNLLGSD